MLGGGQKARNGAFLLDLLWPIACCGCQQPSVWLCNNCRQQLIADWHWQQLAVDKNSSLININYCANYQQPLLNKLLKLTKYQRLTEPGKILALNFANFVQQTIARELWFSQSIITAIPLSRQRFNWRGFNQAELLAKTLAKINHQQIINCWQRQQRLPQAQLSRNKRLINLTGTFSWPQQLTKQNIIIIDDVVTTGATLTQAANCLKQSGAGEIRGLVLAH